jgi:hypothetical protein
MGLAGESVIQESFVERPKTLAEIKADLAAGRTKAVDLAADYYERIEKKNPRLNVYLGLTKERALAQAARIDELAAKGDPLPALAGVPVGIKDVLVMEGAPATAGSKILEGYRPPYDATSVAKLEAAGAVLMGKINCEEGRAAARRRRLRPTWQWRRWEAIRADRFASRLVSAGWWACCRRMDASRGMV